MISQRTWNLKTLENLENSANSNGVASSELYSHAFVYISLSHTHLVQVSRELSRPSICRAFAQCIGDVYSPDDDDVEDVDASSSAQLRVST